MEYGVWSMELLETQTLVLMDLTIWRWVVCAVKVGWFYQTSSPSIIDQSIHSLFNIWLLFLARYTICSNETLCICLIVRRLSEHIILAPLPLLKDLAIQVEGFWSQSD